ncbi:MAG: pilin [Rhodanobacter sp.]|nr:pilin [Rhodanobacter sp.]
MQTLQKGFTLIELMIVVAIVAILAVFALPAYQDYVARAQMGEALNLADGLKTAVAEYWSNTATCPTNKSPGPATGGLNLDTDIVGKYVLSVEANADSSTPPNCTITATMNGTGVASGIVSKTLTLTMDGTTKPGSYVWTCASTAAKQYLPSACQ